MKRTYADVVAALAEADGVTRGRMFGADGLPGHGRPMKQWIAVAPGAELDWVAIAREAMHFAARG